MTYDNKFVMCVLVNGQPQKELANNTVPIPFGMEYVLRFRNKHNRRAVVNFTIDGEDVSGNGYIVEANDYIDIKRHSNVDRAFKFVSLDSAEAIDHGKNGPNYDKVKGTIEARFTLEKVKPVVTYRKCFKDSYPQPRSPFTPESPKWNPSYPPICDIDPPATMCDSSEEGIIQASCGDSLEGSVMRGMMQTSSFSPELQDGATVEGNVTGQSFQSVHVDLESNSTTLKLFLQGFEEVPQTLMPVPHNTPAKNVIIGDLESENEELRKKIAELENEKLKEKLNELQS